MVDLQSLDASNVLLSSPAFSANEHDVCTQLLTRSDRSAVIGVPLTQSPDEWLSEKRAETTTLPSTIRLVDAGGKTRSATTLGDLHCSPGDTEVTITTIPDPGNLTKLGVTLTECFQAVVRSDEDDDVALCFGELSSLLQHSDSRTVYRFLSVLTNHVAANDIEAHYHVDPGAIDDQDYNRFKMLVDAAVTISADGEHTIKSR